MATGRKIPVAPQPPPIADGFSLSAKQVFQGFVGALLTAAVIGNFTYYAQLQGSIQSMQVEQGKQGVALQNANSLLNIYATREELKRVEQKGDQTRSDLDRLLNRLHK